MEGAIVPLARVPEPGGLLPGGEAERHRLGEDQRQQHLVVVDIDVAALDRAPLVHQPENVGAGEGGAIHQLQAEAPLGEGGQPLRQPLRHLPHQ